MIPARTAKLASLTACMSRSSSILAFKPWLTSLAHQDESDDAQAPGNVLWHTPTRLFPKRHIRTEKKLSLLTNTHDRDLNNRFHSSSQYRRPVGQVQLSLSAEPKIPVPTTRHILAERIIWTMIHRSMRHRLAKPRLLNGSSPPSLKILYYNSSVLSSCPPEPSSAVCSIVS